ncbi:uncharacterized protein HMPREF1541_09337 [Cyphellophora europaea CBS 101466]|uniref:Uncharacterized protein n=1 Tax=Cyphellophora europaea (strain CBS 101466) TaxID=1220924 RepID=W2SA48_CYPE1|nr:uncharacterized protein HMPREF1541_09337 [Cyphellophora europaea CBS 101466]ETN45505.1 hypothetical protein HMPREF1541_09337 [Cyphellophora europaea CBS 101466]
MSGTTGDGSYTSNGPASSPVAVPPMFPAGTSIERQPGNSSTSPQPSWQGPQGGQPTSPAPLQDSVPRGQLAGAVVGSLLGGAVATSAGIIAFLAWRKRKKRRHRRHLRIQNSFLMQQPEDDGKPPPGIGLSHSTGHEHQDAATGSENAMPKRSIIAAGPNHIASHVNLLEEQKRYVHGENATTSSATQLSGPMQAKRQSLPRALSSGNPRRTISISASGLISPVAATHAAKEKAGMGEIVRQLRMQVSTLFEQIGLHVDNFYQDQMAAGSGSRLDAEQQRQLQLFDSPYLDDSLAGLLPFAQDARVLLKHSITETVVSRLDYSSRIDANEALLPSGLLNTYRLMTASTLHDSATDVQHWRTHTLGLLGIDSIEKSMSLQVQSLAAAITGAFEPWAVSRYGTEAKTSHLGNLLKEAVELGLEIFGMQNAVHWSWEIPEGSKGEVVVFPSLLILQESSGNAGGSKRSSRVLVGTEIEVVQPVLGYLKFET